MLKIPLGTPCLVEWTDAWTESYAEITPSNSEKEKGLLTRSLGFCLSNTKDGIMLTRTNVPNNGAGTWRGPHFIPKGMISSIKQLK